MPAATGSAPLSKSGCDTEPVCQNCVIGEFHDREFLRGRTLVNTADHAFAAASITSITNLGCESIGTWLLSIA